MRTPIERTTTQFSVFLFQVFFFVTNLSECTSYFRLKNTASLIKYISYSISISRGSVGKFSLSRSFFVLLGESGGEGVAYFFRFFKLNWGFFLLSFLEGKCLLTDRFDNYISGPQGQSIEGETFFFCHCHCFSHCFAKVRNQFATQMFTPRTKHKNMRYPRGVLP